MALIILTTASGSPLTIPSDFTVTGHKVNLFGSGGNGAVGTSGTSGTSAGGGGGGACTVLTYSSGTVTPGSTTVAFLINAGGSANATQWESSVAGTGNFYEALPGGNGASAGTAGAASGSTTTVGTPAIVYTPVNHTGGAGGAGGGANTLGAGGGGGSGGLAANGGGGGTPTGTGGGGGGGGGAANAGGSPSTATGGTGGNGSTGSGGTGAATANPGTGSSGGGGGNGGGASVGGLGGSGTDVSSDASVVRFGSTAIVGIIGCGGGGGGSGRNTAVGATNAIGANGGQYGGGGGGSANSRSGTGTNTAGTGSAGIIAITYESTAWNFDQQLERFASRRGGSVAPKQRIGAITEDRDDGSYVQVVPPSPPFAWEIQPPQPRKNIAKRGPGLRGRSEFAVYPPPFREGWQIQPPQPPRRRWEKAGATMRGDDGHQAPLIRFFPYGWEIQPPQPPRRKWEKSAAALPFKDVPELPMPPSVISYFHIQFSDLKVRVANRYPGLKGKSEFAIYPMPFAEGWQIQPPQPPHPRRERSAAIAVGDTGAEAPFIPPAVTTWFEVNPVLRPHRRYKSPEYGDAAGINFPQINFFPVGFEQVFSQDRHPRPERSGAFMFGHGGIEFQIPTAVPWFEITPALTFHRRFKSPEYGDLGIQFPQINFFPVGWEQVASQDRHRFYKSPDVGDSGIAFPFIQFIPTSWPEPPMYRHPPRERFGAMVAKDDGITFPFIFQFPITYWPAAETYPHPRREKFGALVRGIDGTDQVLLPWFNDGWEQVASQDKHRFWKSPDTGDQGIVFPFVPSVFPWFETTPALLFHRLFKSPDVGDQGIAFPQINFFPSGWEQTTSQPRHRFLKSPEFGDLGIQSPFIRFVATSWPEPPMYRHPRPERAGAIMRGDDGNLFPFAFQFQFIDWPAPPVYPHPRREKAGSLMLGDGGIEQILLPWFNLGWEQIFTQPPHRRWKSPEFGDQGTEFTRISFFPWGFDQIASQDKHRIFKSPDIGDQGIENTFLFMQPVWGFDQVFTQPLHRFRKSPEFGDQGIAFPFTRFFPYGWEVQPPQPPHRWVRHRGLFLRADEGIEAIKPLTILPNVAWPHPLLWKHPRREKAGSIMRGEEGIENPFKFVFSAWGWDAQHVQPPHFFHGKLLGPSLRGDEGIYFPFIPPPKVRHPDGKVFIIDAVPSMDRPLFFFGPYPLVNESCALVFYVGPGLPTFGSRIRFIFTRPDGTFHDGDPNWAFIGQPDVFQRYLPNFPRGQYLVYIFDDGELNQPGIWQVSAIADHFFSNTYTFRVLPTPPAHWPDH